MEPATIPYQKAGEGFAIGAGVKVEVYSLESFFTGYNQVYFALYDSLTDQRIENAQITLIPMMDMGTMMHAAPTEDPCIAAIDRLFPGAVVFTMPSGSMGSWKIDANIFVNGKTGKFSLPVTVNDPAVSRLRSFVSEADNSKFFVALLQPFSPKVGVNDMEIAVYKAQGMMSYPADSSLSVTLTPEMPTMNHGSPNNVDPVHIGKGHYKGKVNFTMTGLWHLNMDYHAGGAVADTTGYFVVNF